MSLFMDTVHEPAVYCAEKITFCTLGTQSVGIHFIVHTQISSLLNCVKQTVLFWPIRAAIPAGLVCCLWKRHLLTRIGNFKYEQKIECFCLFFIWKNKVRCPSWLLTGDLPCMLFSLFVTAHCLFCFNIWVYYNNQSAALYDMIQIVAFYL